MNWRHSCRNYGLCYGYPFCQRLPKYLSSLLSPNMYLRCRFFGVFYSGNWLFVCASVLCVHINIHIFSIIEFACSVPAAPVPSSPTANSNGWNGRSTLILHYRSRVTWLFVRLFVCWTIVADDVVILLLFRRHIHDNKPTTDWIYWHFMCIICTSPPWASCCEIRQRDNQLTFPTRDWIKSMQNHFRFPFFFCAIYHFSLILILLSSQFSSSPSYICFYRSFYLWVCFFSCRLHTAWMENVYLDWS